MAVTELYSDKQNAFIKSSYWAVTNLVLFLQIIFESVRGHSFTSDIAVDDISFTDGPCPTQSKPLT